MLLIVLLITGCNATSGVMHTSPTLTLSKSALFGPHHPIAFTVIDHNVSERGIEFVIGLTKEICSAYPNAFVASSPNFKPAQGQVSMKIGIRQLGAFFNRTKVSLLSKSGYNGLVVGDHDNWQSVIDAAKPSQSEISGTVGGPLGVTAGWSGIAYLEIEIHDLREIEPHVFTVPIATERSTPNNFGIITAGMNSAEAWSVTAPRLSNFLDASVMKIIAEQKTETTFDAPKFSCNGATEAKG